MKIQELKKRLIFIAIVAVGLVLFGGVQWSKVAGQWSPVSSDWYAVYLTNNQVYFGHLAESRDSTLVLKDVYYAEVYQTPAQTAKSKNFALQQTTEQSIRMVRKGDDPSLASDHALYINRTSVLYWEKLANASEAVQSIMKVKADTREQ